MDRRTLVTALCVGPFAALLGCEDSGKVSASHASAHVQALAAIVERDVGQVRKGLPEGAGMLGELWRGEEDPQLEPERVRKKLARVREAVFELSIAKSTFFAVATADGLVIRSDQDVDTLAQKRLWPAFPKLEAATKQYTEATGNMPEVLGVKGKPDGQWVAAAPIRAGDSVKGVYVTGWSWAKYCYSLEEGLRSSVRSSLIDDEGNIDKEPLLYVFLVVDGTVYSAPAAPQFNADKIAELDVPAKLSQGDPYSLPLEIDGRAFGLGAHKLPVWGEGAAVVVLRSET